MKKALNVLSILVIATTGLILSSAFSTRLSPEKASFHMPYKKAGLTDRQAAAHLLSRFTYGTTPQQIDQLVAEGLENWFMQQLSANNPDDSLNQLLSSYDILKLNNAEIENTYPRAAQVLRMAIKDNVVDKDSVRADKKSYREQLKTYMEEKGFKPEQELTRQFINQKILRAAYSQNQLQEVMTTFWFNHFNVSFTKPSCAHFIPNYERDVIRPNALGNFENLLAATAKSPAMLFFLDNFSSSGINTSQQKFTRIQTARLQPNKAQDTTKPRKKNNANGLNENYAREVMELHTLSVDGGYTQADVTQAAKVFTGWTVYPMGNGANTNPIIKMLDQTDPEKLKERGFVHEGDFLFVPARHDNGEKTVLGNKFPAGGGYEEGKRLLHMLATNPSTANFICEKIAIRFVSDTPSKSLVNKMVKTFKEQNGDIKKVLITMVSAPEFWSKEALREKIKSPFELVISSIRSTQAQIKQPYQLFTWLNRMGEKIYYYQAPTGFPDKNQYWINTGALLNRMNFGLALASNRIPGVQVNLLALNQYREPESPEAALATYCTLLMPERNMDETIKRMTPLLTNPDLQQKVANAASKTDPAQQQAKKKTGAKQPPDNNNGMLAQVAGIIIGSPEYQRR